MSFALPSEIFLWGVRRERAISSAAIAPLTAFLDCFLLLSSAWLGTIAYKKLTFDVGESQSWLGLGSMAAILFVALARTQGLYKLRTILSARDHLLRLGMVLFVTQLCLIFILFLLKEGAQYSRGGVLCYIFLAAASTLASRLALSAAAAVAIRHGFLARRRAVTIGHADEIERFEAKDLLHYGIDEVARFSLSSDPAAEKMSDADVVQISTAISRAREMGASELALFMPWSYERQLVELSGLIRSSPLAARLYPDRNVRHVFGLSKELNFDPYVSVMIQREPLNGIDRATKRIMDVVIGGVALAVLAPLMLMVAIAIKVDSKGPVLFRQRRCGFDGRQFMILKFRSMTVFEDNEVVVQAKKNDVRVTRFGRILRRTSIDELPQIINVLRGEMSLVGPRPHALAHDDEYKGQIARYALRHHVKPGLTGTAQISGCRGEIKSLDDLEKRVQHDVWYINNWYPGLDLLIMARTFISLLRHEAY